MKPSPSPLLLLLLLVSISAIKAASPTDFIRTSCGATRYPALCIQCLSSYAPTVHRNPRQLAHAALSVSADRARAASSFVSRLSSSASKLLTPREAGAVKDCIETMADSVDRLRSSMKEMAHMGRAGSQDFGWHLSNVQTWVSAALTDESTCLDGLHERRAGDDAGVRAAIRKKVVDVAHVTSNALALVNKIH
ncbi:hypothetical protein J5N97_025478 [Dioscorea zingiberensis]|uniref:Pectinesterase inhibitor domain-containing protein n=1 Tax=Dioscorea zingiberensis TaxID=325984 RepID=A0A9D5C8C4_9LILI|nr:hypothetical protein J5N97_025478 [Dioscorea zingiberensis]